MIYIALAALLLACTPEPAATQLTAPIQRGPLIFEGSWHGELQAQQSQLIQAPELQNVSALTIESVLPDGAEVKKDQIVLTFVRGPLEDDLRTREADLAVAEAELRRAEQDLAKERIDLELEVQRRDKALERARLQVVEGVNLISRLELERARLDVQRAEIELNLARKALAAFAQKRDASLEVQRLKVQTARDKVEESRVNLGRMEVKSPSDGVLYAPYVRLNWVRTRVAQGKVARPGDQLLQIPDLAAFEVHTYVRQRDAAILREGDPATVYPTARPDAPLTGRVLRKEAFATTRNERLGTETPDGALKEVLIVVALDATLPELRPGGTARVDLRSTLDEDVLRVPLAAVHERADQRFVLRPGDPAEHPITLGRTTTAWAEVLDGLQPGDTVLLGEPPQTPPAP